MKVCESFVLSEHLEHNHSDKLETNRNKIMGLELNYGIVVRDDNKMQQMLETWKYYYEKREIFRAVDKAISLHVLSKFIGFKLNGRDFN